MKYIVSRTSTMGHETPPCKEAEEFFIHNIWKRDFKCDETNPIDVNALRAYTFIGKEGDSYIYICKEASKVWTVDIEDLNAFADKYGDIIIFSEIENQEGLREIEIYDTSRE